VSLENKTILISGGSGTFGHAFVRFALDSERPPLAIRILSRHEDLQEQMRRTFNDDNRLRFFIGDVRDKERLIRAMDGVDIVIHAAALKQVPACEYSPLEAIKTNIQGTANVIDAAIDTGVPTVIAISTDKAVHASNLYGATKLVAEKLMIQGNSYSNRSRFSCVRYGNVIGSRGSVVPLFLEQKKSGVITITDTSMTRFWITQKEGVQFVVNCLNIMHGGEIFVPKIPCSGIMDMAKAIAPECKIKNIGIRPGEKLSEVLITEEESRHAREFDSFYIIDPELPYWGYKPIDGGKPLPDGYRYVSDNLSQTITVGVLRHKVEEK
jgi:UDP-N-acetylglucosamine 4,6-dehydratase/5-epimerase